VAAPTRERDEPRDPSRARQIRDPVTGALRIWFDPHADPQVVGPFVPRELAWRILRQHAADLGGPQVLADLRERAVLGVDGGISVRFDQESRGVPVWAAEVLVNMHADARIHSIYSQYHHDIPPALDPRAATVTPRAVRELVARLARPYDFREIGRPVLLVYRFEPVERPLPGRPPRRTSARARFLAAVADRLRRGRRAGFVRAARAHYLVWATTLTTRPLGRWWVLVDAITGQLLEVQDLLSYARGRAKVFDPNPVVSSGDLTLSSATPTKTLNALRVSVHLDNLDPADRTGRLGLDGAWVRMEDPYDPRHVPPRSGSGRFVFSSRSWKFQDVMVYHHVDRCQEYLQSDLGLVGVADFSIPVDPQGGEADSSSGSASELVFGGGGVPDAADAMVILHEYGHALQDAVNPGSNVNNYSSGVAEGFADFLAAAYYDDKHRPVNPPTRGILFSWNFNPIDVPNKARHYDHRAPANTGVWQQGGGYDKGALWASAMFELYRKLGGDSPDPATRRKGRDLAIRLHVVANGSIPSADATVTQMAQQIEAADTALAGWRYANGLHLKVIYDTFARRKVDGYDPRPVDVYVDDGRHGGYGAADGNDDDFQNVLWLENYRDARDIWVRRAPYGAGAQPSPHDHEAPAVNQPAFVYVRVGNRGASSSGPVNVRAFAVLTGSNPVWPAGWIEMAAPAVQPADVPAAGSAIVGPFAWVPTQVGTAPVLAVVECAADRAVTQWLQPGDTVAVADLVPFDNNIALRDVAVSP
jgi:zinc metalloprotease ZmpB